MKSTLVSIFLLLIFVTAHAQEARPEKRTSDKGLYVTHHVGQSKGFLEYIKKQAKKHGLNTLVVDSKPIIQKHLLPLIEQKKLNRDFVVQKNLWLSHLAEELHKEDFIVSTRIEIFKDSSLARARPDLAVKRKYNLPYQDFMGQLWADPYSKEAQDYNLLLVEIACKSGVDEVQFDYIRFPAEGDVKDLKFPFEDNRSRVEVISSFLKEAREITEKYNVSLAADVFGIIAWDTYPEDRLLLGQSLEAMAEHLDVISPMLYPSHFHPGFDGFSWPGEKPYYFVSQGVEKTLRKIKGTNCKLVPWIQGFDMATQNFGKGYIKEQIDACTDLGVKNYLIWNAGNRYDWLP